MAIAATPSMNGPSTAPGIVTIVTQTRVRAEQEIAFTAWQEKVSRVAASHVGFIDQKVIPASPPAQVDWVILQRFSSMEDAQQWMHSGSRLKLIDSAQPLLVGNDDIHIIPDSGSGVLPAPVSAVISTRVRPGQEQAYREWERRIAAAQARAPGFQGYRIEPPIPGVQESWLAIVRFDSDASLDGWMKSPERLKLLAEGEPLSLEVRARTVRTGFDQWFPAGNAAGAAAPPAWKQNMLVLLQLYPVVFLFGLLVQGPLLMKTLHMPFWLALFFGNVAGVLLLNWLVPWTSQRFSWWLQPAGDDKASINLLGAGLIVALYAASMLVFSLLP
ncbi:antibiotic biosynthesis monooxygenase [Polaromonas naphthalenivorans]|uniref:Antibiotic biosynthesis monooxygenase n=1 Tax=Polaromonas naphthalenivorans (strain CJ2) TaxID=365044 RepID=A1VQS0_POLNA|nr:antibiotic biosynthesis monooxygenase [Polaromonas naphthalenivorans]ABM37998.1 Antibiotic biosynthesis monooxygenase [Polaromonas naphthalenivorans CJ2]